MVKYGKTKSRFALLPLGILDRQGFPERAVALHVSAWIEISVHAVNRVYSDLSHSM